MTAPPSAPRPPEEGWVYHAFKHRAVPTWRGVVCVDCGLHIDVHLQAELRRGPAGTAELARLNEIVSRRARPAGKEGG